MNDKVDTVCQVNDGRGKLNGDIVQTSECSDETQRDRPRAVAMGDSEVHPRGHGRAGHISS
jgi:hypothetical protein